MKMVHEIGWQKVFKFAYWTILLILFKLTVFSPLRVLYLRLLGAKIGQGTILMGVSFTNLYYKGLSNFVVGKYCYIGEQVMIDLAEKVELADYVVLADRVIVNTHTHLGYKNHPLRKYFPNKQSRVILRNGCFIGTGAIILSGVIIGEEAVVGAGAVVTKSVARRVIVAGVPAKPIKRL